jgi:hypothetical protein
MICDIIPKDIQSLIISAYSEGFSDKEMNKMLPPKYVIDAVLGERGIKAPLGDAQMELARDWCARQQEIQSVVAKTHHALMELEPLTQEMAVKGELPAWCVRSWAVTMLFDWSADLEDAMVSAMEYLDAKKTPTR